MNRYEAFPDVGGAAMRRRDHRLSRQRVGVIAAGAALLIGTVAATAFFGTSLMRKQANTTWGVITAVSAPAVSPAMAASLAAKKASFTTAASAPPSTAAEPAVATTPAPAPTPAVATSAAPAPASTPAPAAVAAPATIAEASKMMDTAALADRPVKDSPVADKIPSLTVAPTVHATSGQAAAFALSVEADGVLPPNSRISIHGLPQEIALSAGHRDDAGDWLLAPNDLSGLTVMPGVTTVASTSDLLVQLKTADGTVANEWHTVLSVTPAAKTADQAPGFAVTEKASPDEIKSWMSHGRDLERVGYLAGARLFFQRAAEAGSAEGARALAETYDPAEFAKLGVHGMEPDPAQAQKWYERAKVLEAKSGATQSGTVP